NGPGAEVKPAVAAVLARLLAAPGLERGGDQLADRRLAASLDRLGKRPTDQRGRGSIQGGREGGVGVANRSVAIDQQAAVGQAGGGPAAVSRVKTSAAVGEVGTLTRVAPGDRIQEYRLRHRQNATRRTEKGEGLERGVFRRALSD